MRQDIRDLFRFFPDTVELRRRGSDVVYGDRDNFPWCGFMSTDESGVLRDAATDHRGLWLEIGSFVGWSAAVIASAGNTVICIDPEYGPDAQTGIRARAVANLDRAGLLPSVELIGMQSGTYFATQIPQPPAQPVGLFAGIVIDGCHDHPEPTKDAANAVRLLSPGGVIVLHDTKGKPVRAAMDHLQQLGFRVTEHDTINGIATAIRP